MPAFAGTLVYANDFDGNSYTREGVGIGWSGDSLWPEGGAYRIATTPDGSRSFLGQFTGSGSRLSLDLSQLPSHTEVTISFDLYVIGPWDGNYGGYDGGSFSVGPDEWFLSWNAGQSSASLAWTTFSNRPEYGQSYPSSGLSGNYPAQTGAKETNNMGYSTSATYHIERTVSSSLDSSRFSMYLQLGHDFCEQGSGRVLESMGIDNIRVETSPTIPTVPEPSSLLALGGGLIGLTGVLRRKK